MFSDFENDSRRILFLSGLFALIGVVSLVAVFILPASEDSRQDFRELFGGGPSPEEELAAKHEVLENLAAMQEVDAEGRPTESAKLKVLESLRVQE